MYFARKVIHEICMILLSKMLSALPIIRSTLQGGSKCPPNYLHNPILAQCRAVRSLELNSGFLTNRAHS